MQKETAGAQLKENFTKRRQSGQGIGYATMARSTGNSQSVKPKKVTFSWVEIFHFNLLLFNTMTGILFGKCMTGQDREFWLIIKCLLLCPKINHSNKVNFSVREREQRVNELLSVRRIVNTFRMRGGSGI